MFVFPLKNLAHKGLSVLLCVVLNQILFMLNLWFYIFRLEQLIRGHVLEQKSFVFWSQIYWSIFLRVQWTNNSALVLVIAEGVTSLHLNQWSCILYVSLCNIYVLKVITWSHYYYYYYFTRTNVDSLSVPYRTILNEILFKFKRFHSWKCIVLQNVCCFILGN